MDIVESGSEVILKADLPDVNLEDIDVQVENETLTIKGERRFEQNSEGYHRIERRYGAFVRSFSVPSTVDPNGVSAAFKNGVLTVKLAKKEAAKPRPVKISA
ncbi:MAG: Hsp20/alpha crystallin family protein [Bryobacteraceae bacterium]